jgi:hypothetical protein
MLLLASPVLAQPAIAPVPGPADPAVARMLASGLNGLCSPFLARPAMSTEALDALATKAGYMAGAPDPYGPVGQAIPGAPPAISFHASASQAADAPMVVLHVTRGPVTCQLRIKGDAAAWSAYLSTMPQHGGRLVTSAALTPETKFSHEVYVGGIAGVPRGYTTFVNRWVGEGAPKGAVYTMINVLPDTGAGF